MAKGRNDMRKAHNRIELDHAYIFEQWKNGKTSDILAKELGVTPIVIFRHLRETAGDNYEALAKEHWQNLAQKRTISRAGKKTHGGARWFTEDEEKEVVKFFSESDATYDDIAKHFNCSRVVVKKLLARLVPLNERKSRELRIRSELKKGKRLVDYVIKECPICHKIFEMPPWLAKTNKVHCSPKCKGIAYRGENSPQYGKVNHGVGQWYKTTHCEMWLRSQWEYVVALYLDKQEKTWKYEPKAFPITIDGKKATYTPDFYLVDDDLYIEVKGWWRSTYLAKHKAFREAYPDIKIEVWDKTKLLELNLITKKGKILSIG